MKSNSKRTQRDYSLAFKLAVVDQVEKGELTYKQAQEHYGIQGCSTILVWLRKHGRLDWMNGTPKFLKRGNFVDKPKEELTPEQRIKALEKELADTKMKADFFEAVVNVLESDYGVSVVKKRKRKVIQENVIEGVSVTKACRYLNISRQAYYQHGARLLKREEHEEIVINFVQHERMIQPRIGTRKLQYLLALVDINIGRDHLFNLLRTRRLLVPSKRAYHKTTHSHHRFRCHPNLIKSGFKAEKPNQLWVADITYLPTQTGESYLSLITDAYSRKIVGYQVDDNMRTQSVKKAFTHALKHKSTDEKLVHHSDRGMQYCSQEYQNIHRKHDVQCSMTDGYDCYQNALAERVNGILKNEYLVHKPRDLEEARKMVAESVAIYNKRRPHLALKYKTPDEVHQAL
ncbi:IS3 family transposase [Pseudoalteromonas sp. SW0106-04]|uniref:IS3 family transposase n=1 Tax=Pseudoalteromonas sp. SW0106-04 TaxID=1702169 RepID=UPI003592F418